MPKILIKAIHHLVYRDKLIFFKIKRAFMYRYFRFEYYRL
jgi:hypothetical protein